MENVVPSSIPKTIDDLGFETYEQFDDLYARFRGETVVQESESVAPRTQVSITQSLPMDHWAALFDIAKKGAPWAAFPMPQDYEARRFRLFKEGLAPSFRDPEYIELLVRRFEGQSGSLEDEGRKNCMDMLQKIQELNTLLQSVNAERYRYAKG